MRRYKLVFLLAAVLLCGCTNVGTDGRLCGKWVQEKAVEVPGWSLLITDDEITVYWGSMIYGKSGYTLTDGKIITSRGVRPYLRLELYEDGNEMKIYGIGLHTENGDEFIRHTYVREEEE